MNQVGEQINVSEITKSCRNLDPNEMVQILHTQTQKFICWGAKRYTIDNNKNCKMFRMSVTGMKHKGYVYIFVNGLDLFDVYYCTAANTIKKIDEGLYNDMLVDAIDNTIEKIPAYKY